MCGKPDHELCFERNTIVPHINNGCLKIILAYVLLQDQLLEEFLSYPPPLPIPTSLQNTFHIQSGVQQWSEGGLWRAFSGTTQIIAENQLVALTQCESELQDSVQLYLLSGEWHASLQLAIVAMMKDCNLIIGCMQGPLGHPRSMFNLTHAFY